MSAKTAKGWAIVGPRGKVYHVASTRFMAWATYCSHKTWQEREERKAAMLRNGFKCLPCTITVTEEPK